MEEDNDRYAHIFESSPQEKFLNILKNINEDTAHDIFDDLILKLAAMELMLDKQSDDVYSAISSFIRDNQVAIERKKQDLYIKLSTDALKGLGD